MRTQEIPVLTTQYLSLMPQYDRIEQESYLLKREYENNTAGIEGLDFIKTALQKNEIPAEKASCDLSEILSQIDRLEQGKTCSKTAPENLDKVLAKIRETRQTLEQKNKSLEHKKIRLEALFEKLDNHAIDTYFSMTGTSTSEIDYSRKKTIFENETEEFSNRRPVFYEKRKRIMQNITWSCQ